MRRPRRKALPFTATAFILVGTIGGCYGANALPGAKTAHVPASPAGSANPAATATATADPRAMPVVAPAGGPASSAVCQGRKLQPTNTTWEVELAGTKRNFVVHVPSRYDPAVPTPVVLNFHGYTMNPKLQEWLTNLSEKADAANFIVVYPEGTGKPLGFNAGTCCGDASKAQTDDVAFTRAMLDRLEADLCVDVRRVFATGMSNGAFMSYRLACDLSDRIAAIGPVAGVEAAPTCSPSRAVSVLHFHGTSDPTIQYNGNTKYGWIGAEESTRAWARRDGCRDVPVQTLASGDVRCVHYEGCRENTEVELCTVTGGGHTWPGGADVPAIAHQGRTTHAVNANDLLWSFFEKHPMPGKL